MITLRDFLEQRRQQLLEFFSWRYGTPFWGRPAQFTTGLPPSLITKLRNRPIECSAASRPTGALTIRDILRAEDAALSLGFRPGRVVSPKGKFTKPPPLNLPRWSDPACRIRYRDWLREERRNKRNTE